MNSNKSQYHEKQTSQLIYLLPTSRARKAITGITNLKRSTCAHEHMNRVGTDVATFSVEILVEDRLKRRQHDVNVILTSFYQR